MKVRFQLPGQALAAGYSAAGHGLLVSAGAGRVLAGYSLRSR